MAKPPDSRVSAGQALEDEADAITDSVRRQAVDWQKRLMRGHPNNARMQTAFVAGLLGGGMDVLIEIYGDASQAARVLQGYLDAYMGAISDDAELDAQPQTQQEN